MSLLSCQLSWQNWVSRKSTQTAKQSRIRYQHVPRSAKSSGHVWINGLAVPSCPVVELCDT